MVLQNKRFWIVQLITVFAVLLLVAWYVAGNLNPRMFAILCLVVVGVSVMVCTRVLRSEPFVLAPRSNTPLRAAFYYVQIAVFLFLLWCDLWGPKGAPWAPRIVGAVVLLLFLLGLVIQRRRVRSR
jgi:hypothetical protein